jgi:putative endonuclease
MSTRTAQIGSHGEDIAVEWLREQGFYIVERNWRIKNYEVDIIAQRWDTLHFIEVKTRHQGGWQSAYDSIDAMKIRSLQRSATAFCAIRRIRLMVEFDLIAITMFDNGRHSIEFTENIL